MAYDSTSPANDEYLADFPPKMREQLRGIIEDQIVNALKLQGLIPANTTGNIPVSNGNVNTNLNADFLDGKHSTSFADAAHTHSSATQQAAGLMAAADKAKLDGIATGAEVNQNAFSNVVYGSTTIQADSKTDTLTLAAGANILITPDATNDKVTIGVTGTVDNAAACSGNAATATKWQTARKIGGVSVDGSADIDLPGVNKAGTQDTSGSATKHGGYTVAQLFDYFHPVGSIWETTTTDDPNTLWAGTTWVKMDAGRVLVSAGTAATGTVYTAGATGGEESHTLSIDEMPSHGHGASAESQGQHTHSLTYTKNDSPAYHGAGSNVGHLGGNGEHWNWSDINTNAGGAHSHNISISSTGGGNAHNNMPPYEVIYRWRRTA